MYVNSHAALTTRYLFLDKGILNSSVAVLPLSIVSSYGVYYLTNESMFVINCSQLTFNMALYLSENVLYPWALLFSRPVTHFVAAATPASRRPSQKVEPCTGANCCSTPLDGSKPINCWSRYLQKTLRNSLRYSTCASSFEPNRCCSSQCAT